MDTLFKIGDITYTLPDGLHTRQVTLDDAEAVANLLNAYYISIYGSPRVQAHQFYNDWQSPSFNLATDALLVSTGDGDVVGCAEVWADAPYVHIYGNGSVHPEHQGRGIGTYLAGWVEARARQALDKAPEGARVVIQQGAPGVDAVSQGLLEAQGYACVRYFFRMFLEMQAPPPEPVWAPGITVRTFDRQRDLRSLVEACREGFRDHWGFVERPLESELADWAQWIDNDPEHDSTLWFLPCARDEIAGDEIAGEEIVGACLCRPKTTEDPEMGYVNSLSVRPAWRKKGLGLAMLHHAFGEYYRRGKRKVSLDVDGDSLTGALRLYERAGMHKIRESMTYHKELRSGVELGTVTLEA